MAEGKSKFVNSFLQAVGEKKFAKAADLFVSVTDEVVADKPLSSIEQQLQLKPTKPYKKLCRLIKDKKALCGVFQTLLGLKLEDSPATICAIRYVCMSRSFAKQVASCSSAVTALHQFGTRLQQRAQASLTHTPALLAPERPLLYGCYFLTRVLESLLSNSQEFAESALAQGYLPLITSFFPLAGDPPGPAELDRADILADLALGTMTAFSNLASNPPEQTEKILSSEAAPSLLSWLIRFCKSMHSMLRNFPMLQQERLASNPGLPLTSLQEAMHRLLFNLCNVCGTADRVNPTILMGNEFEELIRVVEKLKPLVGDSDKQNVEHFLREAQRFKMRDSEGYGVPADLGTVLVMLQSVKLGGAPDPAKAVNELADRLWSLSIIESKLLLGAGIVDTLLGTMLSEMRRVHEAQGGPLDFVRLLAFCFYKGRVPPADWPKYSHALVGAISRELVDGVSINTAWHFLAVLVGARDWFEPHMVCSDFLDSRTTTRPQPAVGSMPSLLSERDAEKLVEQGLKWIDQVCYSQGVMSAIGRDDRVQDAAGVVLFACVEFPATCVQVELFTKLLAALSERLATDFKRCSELGAASNEAKVEEMQRSVPFLGTLLRIFGLALDSCWQLESAGETFLWETARDGGTLTCQNVLRISRALSSSSASSSLPGALNGMSDEGLGSEGMRIWTVYAAKFNLKPCSRLACTGEVVEIRQKTFNLCSACHGAQYCSRECQKVDWKTHKAECKKSVVS
ncbi:hypothetical protein KFL_003750120 [Klebsormidium nitens]|uniref:MYND-type domain-containing protein n=1 Tax=Klebsormidium nitens TaxID=105231 RepID=A0A1Y1ICU0_KLENI|nr:hypothetical protein KFL_003750120 [Klebsormidium nitens]|eukprot:GAQ87762.1 hypothetical protein KFL_003750120 [Klebsormidium nitens]